MVYFAYNLPHVKQPLSKDKIDYMRKSNLMLLSGTSFPHLSGTFK